jgi:hypothetical protein
LLTKTVSFRSRTHASWELAVHGTHVAAMFAGEAIAQWGAWASSTRNLAGWVIVLLAYGAITFAFDVFAAAREDNADSKATDAKSA